MAPLAVVVAASLLVLGESAPDSGCSTCVLGFCWGCVGEGVMGLCIGCEEKHLAHEYVQQWKPKDVKTEPHAAIQIEREVRNRSAHFRNVTSKSLTSDPDRAYQNKFGPKGGQDAGFQKFMPQTEKNNYHRYSNDQGRAGQASPSVNTPSPGYGAQGTVSKDMKTAGDAAIQLERRYKNSSTRVRNVSSKSLSSDPDRAYQNKFGPNAGQDAGFQKFMPHTEKNNYHRFDKGSSPVDRSLPGYGWQNIKSQYDPFQLAEESHADVGQIKHGSIVAIFLPVATAAALILAGWASVAAISRSRPVADEEEVAERYLFLA